MRNGTLVKESHFLVLSPEINHRALSWSDSISPLGREEGRREGGQSRGGEERRKRGEVERRGGKEVRRKKGEEEEAKKEENRRGQ